MKLGTFLGLLVAVCLSACDPGGSEIESGTIGGKCNLDGMREYCQDSNISYCEDHVCLAYAVEGESCADTRCKHMLTCDGSQTCVLTSELPCDLRNETCIGECVNARCEPGSNGLTLGTDECSVGGSLENMSVAMRCLARYTGGAVYFVVFDNDYSTPKVFDADSQFIQDEGGLHLSFDIEKILDGGVFEPYVPTMTSETSFGVTYVDEADVMADSASGTITVSNGEVEFYADSNSMDVADDGMINATLAIDLDMMMPGATIAKQITGTLTVTASKGSSGGAGEGGTSGGQAGMSAGAGGMSGGAAGSAGAGMDDCSACKDPASPRNAWDDGAYEKIDLDTLLCVEGIAAADVAGSYSAVASDCGGGCKTRLNADHTGEVYWGEGFGVNGYIPLEWWFHADPADPCAGAPVDLALPPDDHLATRGARIIFHMNGAPDETDSARKPEHHYMVWYEDGGKKYVTGWQGRQSN